MPVIINPYIAGRSFSFVGSCVSAGANLDFSSLSAGVIASGDFAVFVDVAVNLSGGSPAAVTPSGFTNHISTAASFDNDYRAMVSSKALSGSEGAITGMNGADRNNKIGLVFRPTLPIAGITAADIETQATSGDPSAQVCDPSAEAAPVIVVGADFIHAGTAAFSTFSPAADGTVAVPPNDDLLAGYKIYNTAPAATTIDANDLGNDNWLGSLYFKFS